MDLKGKSFLKLLDLPFDQALPMDFIQPFGLFERERNKACC